MGWEAETLQPENSQSQTTSPQFNKTMDNSSSQSQLEKTSQAEMHEITAEVTNASKMQTYFFKKIGEYFCICVHTWRPGSHG